MPKSDEVLPRENGMQQQEEVLPKAKGNTQPVLKEAKHYEDSDPVTVMWNNYKAIPRDHATYMDRYLFQGGIGYRIPYKEAKKWIQQGHGIQIFDADASEKDFIRATNQNPTSDFFAMLHALSPDKIAALLSPEVLDKITAIHSKK